MSDNFIDLNVDLFDDQFAEDVRYQLKFGDKVSSKDDLLNQLHGIRNAIDSIKRSGISMWNYKSQIPKIFGIVESYADLMEEIVKNLPEGKKND